MNEPRLLEPRSIPPVLTCGLAGTVLRIARILLAALAKDFGRPAAFLARRVMTPIAHRAFLECIRPVELLLRRWLCTEALAWAFALPATQRQKSGPAPPPPKPGPDRENSERWQVSFAVLRTSSPKRALNPAYVFAPPPPDEMSTRPLALRLEAAIRVATNPIPFILRLARRFRRKPPHKPERLFAPLNSGHKIVDDLLDDLAVDAATKARLIADTS